MRHHISTFLALIFIASLATAIGLMVKKQSEGIKQEYSDMDQLSYPQKNKKTLPK